jgi:RNA polymerase sigma factor (sigma-70 family)
MIHRGLPQFDLEDLIQEAEIETWRAAADFDSSFGLHFTQYAYQRVRGAVLMTTRRRFRIEAGHEQLDDEAHDRPDPREDIEARVNLQERLGLLSTAIWRLPVEERELMLALASGRPMPDAAKWVRRGLTKAYELRKSALAHLRSRMRVPATDRCAAAV